MSNNNSSLKGLGVVMVAFGLIYAILGTLALAGMMQGLLPGHESGEAVIMILAYAVAILALVCGYACIKGNRGTARTLGIVFAVIGLVSLIYTQISQSAFNYFDCLALLLGVAIVFQAKEK